MNYYRCAGLWLQCATTDKKTSRLWVEVQSEAPISSFNKLGGWNPSHHQTAHFLHVQKSIFKNSMAANNIHNCSLSSLSTAQKYNLSVRLELASGRGMLHPKWKSKFPELQRQVGGKVHKSANRKSRKSAMHSLCFSINPNRSTDHLALQSKEITACSFQSETACCPAERRRDRGSKL